MDCPAIDPPDRVNLFVSLTSSEGFTAATGKLRVVRMGWGKSQEPRHQEESMATIYFFKRICVCTSCVCMCCVRALCICVHICMWRSEVTLGVFINNAPLYYFRLSHWIWSCLIQLATWPVSCRDSPASASPEQGSQANTTMSRPWLGRWSEARSSCLDIKHSTARPSPQAFSVYISAAQGSCTHGPWATVHSGLFC